MTAAAGEEAVNVQSGAKSGTVALEQTREVAMNVRTVNRLVRSKIPERITVDGGSAQCSLIPKDELPRALQLTIMETTLDVERAAAEGTLELVSVIADVVQAVQDLLEVQHGPIWEVFVSRIPRTDDSSGAGIWKHRAQLLYMLAEIAKQVAYDLEPFPLQAMLLPEHHRERRLRAQLEEKLLQLVTKLRAFAHVSNIEWERIESARILKRIALGGYREGCFLDSIAS